MNEIERSVLGVAFRVCERDCCRIRCCNPFLCLCVCLFVYVRVLEIRNKLSPVGCITPLSRFMEKQYVK